MECLDFLSEDAWDLKFVKDRREQPPVCRDSCRGTILLPRFHPWCVSIAVGWIRPPGWAFGSPRIQIAL